MPIKILVVDDSATDRLIIQAMLQEYKVLTATNGEEAMSLLQQHKDIDLVILDLNMPQMNGFEVLERLKQNVAYKKIRCIILTNYDELDNEIRGLKAGAVDYIRKPVHMESLKARIDIHVELLRVQRLLEEKIVEQSITFDALFLQAPIGIAIFHNKYPMTESGGFIIANPKYEEITGRNREELIRLGWAGITHPEDLLKENDLYRQLQQGELEQYSLEKRFCKPDGSLVWVQIVVAKLHLKNESPYDHVCLVQDITHQKETEQALVESERSKSVLLSHLPGMAYRCHYNRQWTMVYVSEGCGPLTGYRPESFLLNRDLSFSEIIVEEYRESLWREWVKILKNHQTFNYEYEIITANGQRKWVLEMGEGVYNSLGEVEALEGIIIDISDRKKMETELRYYSEHDTWTNLFNRRYLENLMEEDAKKPAKRALVAVNVRDAYLLSMTYGFHYSQELIRKAAELLKGFCRPHRLLFSTYENQFAFYIREYEDRNQLVQLCDQIAEVLRPLLAMERIRAGLGILEIQSNESQEPEILLRNLQITSEKAVVLYENDIGYCFFDFEMQEQLIREGDIKRELAQIAEQCNDSRFFLQFQPILDLRTGKISGFEALARLNSDKYGSVSPLEFIPIAEETKLIIPLGECIIRQAFDFHHLLKAHGFGELTISINISAVQLLRPFFTEAIQQMLASQSIDPDKVGFEITESVFSEDYHALNEVLGSLKELGMEIAIDDFGTGYSSLARERELHVTCLKIDKYFIDKLVFLSEEDAITGAIITMAHKMGHTVIAEGIEHDVQMTYLRKAGCDKIQGYLISRPLNPEAAIEFLKNYSK